MKGAWALHDLGQRRLRLGALVLLCAVACLAGGCDSRGCAMREPGDEPVLPVPTPRSTSEPVRAPAPPSSQAQSATSPEPSRVGIPAPPSAWQAALATQAPFGCDVRAIERGVLVQGTIESDAFRAWAESAARQGGASVPVPEGLRAQVPRPAVVFEIGGAGPCRARLGQAVLVGAEGRPVAGFALSGCPRDVAPFALACPARTVALPAGARWSSLRPERVRDLPATGATGDPHVDEAFGAFDELLGDAERRSLQTSSAHGEPELRRVRTASLVVGTEELRVIDLARVIFERGGDPTRGCPSVEYLPSAVYLASGGVWRRISTARHWVGAVHDGVHVLALVNEHVEDGPACAGAAGCRVVSIHARDTGGELRVAATAAHNFTSGDPIQAEPLSITMSREGCEED